MMEKTYISSKRVPEPNRKLVKTYRPVVQTQVSKVKISNPYSSVHFNYIEKGAVRAPRYRSTKTYVLCSGSSAPNNKYGPKQIWVPKIF